MLNDQGKSFSFDERGSGYGRGEGLATVILKRLDDAIEAGDSIRAIIRATAVNQDGRTAGITLPDRSAQELLQRTVLDKAQVSPLTVDYIEAHGTGTIAGDSAEVGSISNVFCNDRTAPLPIGSIKSNIGHLESCSGLAGLVKAVLMLEKQAIPPTVNFETPKPNLRLKERMIRVRLCSLCLNVSFCGLT